MFPVKATTHPELPRRPLVVVAPALQDDVGAALVPDSLRLPHRLRKAFENIVGGGFCENRTFVELPLKIPYIRQPWAVASQRRRYEQTTKERLPMIISRGARSDLHLGIINSFRRERVCVRSDNPNIYRSTSQQTRGPPFIRCIFLSGARAPRPFFVITTTAPIPVANFPRQVYTNTTN